jgi:L-alanine-DL-glutamate epimerase-like enolase superfamily enzyme
LIYALTLHVAIEKFAPRSRSTSRDTAWWLDKCGGLTEGLAMARKARRLGLDVMVGNMVGTSLAMAPSCLVRQLCKVVDLDGPVFLSTDRALFLPRRTFCIQ